MKAGLISKGFGLLAVAVMLGSTFAFAVDTPTKKAASKQPSRLVAALPSSDAIAVISVKRFFDEMLPSMLAGEQKLFGEIVTTMNEIENKTGIRFRQFDEVAVGVTYKAGQNGKTNYEPVIIAGGTIDRAAIAAGIEKAPVERVEKRTIADREVFVVKASPEVLNKAGEESSEAAKKAKDAAAIAFASEMAIAIIDDRTIAAGPLESVERALTSPVKPTAAMSELLSKRAGSVVNFAMSKPPAMTELIPADLDDLGKSVASIEMFYGSMDPVGTGMQLHLTARTTTVKNATDLRRTLVDMQGIGKGVFGRSKRADQQMYHRFINNVQFNSVGKDVSLSLLMSRDDASALVGMLVK